MKSHFPSKVAYAFQKEVFESVKIEIPERRVVALLPAKIPVFMLPCQAFDTIHVHKVAESNFHPWISRDF